MKHINRSNGFTLMEIMIVVVILGILAGIAIPAYQTYVERSRRVDATTELMRIAAAQEKFYLQNNTYANEGDLATFIKGGTATTDLETQYGYYGITVSGINGASTATAFQQGFVVTATPAADSLQINDTDCRNFVMDQSGTRSATNSGGTDNSANCWK
jgi:type IV pilus assembly protein PilE